MLKVIAKRILRTVSFLVVSPLVLFCWVERRRSPACEAIFCCSAQLLSLLPGIVGVYLRRSFYQGTLDHCASDVFIGFGAIFSHRHARVESQVYIGCYALIGAVVLRRRCMIGSRASLLSGGHLHRRDENGDWGAADLGQLQQIEIGENAWLGEAVVVLANVGSRAMVSAGAVVANPVPDQIMVGGNPARFIRRLAEGDATSAGDGESAGSTASSTPKIESVTIS